MAWALHRRYWVGIFDVIISSCRVENQPRDYLGWGLGDALVIHVFIPEESCIFVVNIGRRWNYPIGSISM